MWGSVESKVNLEGRSQLKLKGANKDTPFRPSTETDTFKVAENIHWEDERSHQWAADISYLTAVVPSLPSSIPHELHNSLVLLWY